MNILNKCDCPADFKIRPHGEGDALYFGRCNHRHGYNLVHLVEPAFNYDAGHIEKLLNLGLQKYKDNPVEHNSHDAPYGNCNPLSPCECVDKFSIERHGKEFALFYGRCPHKHGYNLAYLTESAKNFHPQNVEMILNLGQEVYSLNPDSPYIAD